MAVVQKLALHVSILLVKVGNGGYVRRHDMLKADPDDDPHGSTVQGRGLSISAVGLAAASASRCDEHIIWPRPTVRRRRWKHSQSKFVRL